MGRAKRHVTLSRPTPANGRHTPKFWTVERQWRLAEYLERGMTDAAIGEKFGVSAEAVMLARKDHGITARTRLHLSARDVARLLGIGCSKTVARWVKMRWLPARRVPRGPHGQYTIPRDWLLAFLEDPAHHHRWQPERITDPALREWAMEIHTGPFLAVGQVAWRLCVDAGTVSTWVQLGRLPAVRHGNWLVREADLDGFVVPSRTDRKPRPWTEAEDAELLAMRGQGSSWREIGMKLNRWPSVCCKRWHGLVGLEAAS